MIEREKELKDLQRNIDKENKIYNVHRTRKKNVFDREQLVTQLNYIDHMAQQKKDNRTDYVESRKLMIQNLNKDLEKLKGGLISIHEIEKKYAYLHNDQEFKHMLAETKKQIHAGNIQSSDASLTLPKTSSKKPTFKEPLGFKQTRLNRSLPHAHKVEDYGGVHFDIHPQKKPAVNTINPKDAAHIKETTNQKENSVKTNKELPKTDHTESKESLTEAEKTKLGNQIADLKERHVD